MQVRSFLMTMGAGVAMGALGAMMLPKNSEVYKQTKKAANAIRREAETAIDSISSMQKAILSVRPPGIFAQTNMVPFPFGSSQPMSRSPWQRASLLSSYI